MTTRYVEREVYLLASSMPHVWSSGGGGYKDWWNIIWEVMPEEAQKPVDFNTDQADPIMEFAGRTCYDAYGRKNPATAENADYLANILDQGHLSVLEHSSFTFLLRNVSRSATHEIVRHRHFSFSQESQRFVHGRKRDIVLPPALDELDDAQLDAIDAAFDENENTYKILKAKGLSHKEASEAARMFLPNAAATNIVITGNARSWKEFIEKRLAPGADAELQGIAQDILNTLEKVNPGVFSEKQRKHWDGKEIQHGTQGVS